VGIRLSVDITTPLTLEDKDPLAGVSVTLMAIANRELGQEVFPDVFREEDTQEPTLPQPCGYSNPDDGSELCMSEVGHRGRHRFRKLTVGTANGLVN
jgi:hypothetical protein